MKRMFTWLMACSLGLVTWGCSSLPSFGNKDNKMVEITASKPNEVPEWFLAKETDNSTELTVTATDVSKDMQFAIDKATLNAKVEMANKLGVKVDSISRESALESGYGVKDVEREIDRVSKTTTSQKVGFYRRENLKVIREGNHYRAYVMLKLSLEEGRRLTYNNESNRKSREERLKELDKE
jgi:hypothetical protein